MKLNPHAKPVVCYKVDNLPRFDTEFYQACVDSMQFVKKVIVEPRSASTFKVQAGQIFRILCAEGAQVGDLNLWNANNLKERFFSGKTRQLHATHLTKGDRLWSNFPYTRYIASIVTDTLQDYGFDEDGGGVHDVIGTRCDPYTNRLLNNIDYHYCCHSNLLKAFAKETNMTLEEAEPYIHDVFNVFMCTGFTKDTHQYFMKASPVEQGDYIDIFAEIDLLGALSACPGGDCSSSHSDEKTQCYPLHVEIYDVAKSMLENWQSPQQNQFNHS